MANDWQFEGKNPMLLESYVNFCFIFWLAFNLVLQLYSLVSTPNPGLLSSPLTTQARVDAIPSGKYWKLSW